MQCESIGEIHGRSEIVTLVVGVGDAKKELFAKRPKAKISADSPMLWRRKGDERGRYEISTLDLANIGFKEIRLDAFSALKELEKSIHVQKLGMAVVIFEQRMATLKFELLKVVRTKEFSAKLDALIHSHHQALLNHGDPEVLEATASEALSKCLERELLTQEKARISQELHSALLEEGSKITREFSDSGVDLKGVLRNERQRAISAGVSIEAGKATMRVAAQNALAAKVESDQRKQTQSAVKAFLDELLASSELYGDRGRFHLESAMHKALKRHENNVELIKEKLLILAREFLGDSVKQLALKQEKLREAQERDRPRLIKDRIKLAVRRPSGISEKALTAEVARMTNRDTPIEEVQNVIDELVRKSLLPSQTAAGRNSIEQRRPEHPNAPTPGNQEGANSVVRRRNTEPFNRSMADKLVGALQSTKKDS